MNYFTPVLCLTALLLTACASVTNVSTPSNIAAQFCTVTQRGDTDGFLKLATSSLAHAIRNAEKKNQIIADKTPGDKPPLGDGIPFQAYPDYAPICNSGKIRSENGKTMIVIHHIFTAPTDVAASWDDRLVLSPSAHGWQIDDILYGPHYDSNLRKALVDAFKSWK